KENVMKRVSSKGLTEIYAKNFSVATGFDAKELGGFVGSVRRQSPGKEYCIPEMCLTGSNILSGGINLSTNPDCGGGFKVKAAENSDRIQGLQLRRSSRIR